MPHIISDKSKFVKFDKDFKSSNHFIELLDGCRTNNLIYGKVGANTVVI